LIFAAIAVISAGALIFYLRGEKNRWKALYRDHLKTAIVALDPEKRYIITLPPEIEGDDFEDIAAIIKRHLELENSQTKIVLMEGSIQVVEFS
jgi:hypothetical protein